MRRRVNGTTTLRGIMISAIGIFLGAVAGLCALLYFSQDRLIFHPQPMPLAAPRAPGLAIEDVRIALPDGNVLHGWLARPGPAATKLPLALYLGGNAEEVSHMAAEAGRFPGWALLAVNYRGYGGSSGSPSEGALCADALAVYDWALTRGDVDAARIVAIGRSLGSGVAVYLASQRPLAGVVLVTPYDSLRAVAQRHYPYAPVSLLLRHPFDSAGLAPKVRTPLLVVAAGRDDIIPPVHARALLAQWAGPKDWREFGQAGHNDLDADPEYWRAIADFLAQRH